MLLVRLQLIDRSSNFASFNVDVFVDEFGKANNRVITYGRWGQLDGEEVWPFLLRPNAGSDDARLDFGFDADDPESQDGRFGWTNLPSKRVRKGELVTFRHNGAEICCEITDAKEMPSGVDFVPISE